MEFNSPMRILRKRLVAIALAAASAMLLMPAGRAEEPSLQSVQVQIEKRNPDIEHIARQTLADALARGEKIALFDVREANEFVVSRLPGAVRVDPGSWSSAFLKRYGSLVAGKKVIFYCSVGVRSTRLAARVKPALLARGAKTVFNLRGGIFAWHNEGRELVNDHGRTDYVHPYDASWGRLVKRKALMRYEPVD